MSFATELTVEVRAEDPDDTLRLRLKVEAVLMEMQNKLPKGGKVRWFCSQAVEKVPAKAPG
jgi:hypothetical protein